MLDCDPAVFSASAQVVIAQSYPARPVRMIVPFPAGGQIDIIARVIAHWLSERHGQQFVVDNRPGAASNIATEALVRSPPDGHTLMFATVSNAVNATLFDKLKFDFIRDTVPVASINRIPLVLEVHPSFPAQTVSDLVSEAKSKPGKINIVTPPKGTAPFMAAALFKVISGVDVVHIPYRGTAQLMGGGSISEIAPQRFANGRNIGQYVQPTLCRESARRACAAIVELVAPLSRTRRRMQPERSDGGRSLHNRSHLFVDLLRCMSPLMASGHPGRSNPCPPL